jgi:hypothetical protein
MSNNLLGVYARPLVLFDVENKDHRKWAWRFFKDSSWKNCPVRFALPDGEDNVCSLIQRLLLAYYSQKEFGRIKPTDREQNYRRHVKNSPTSVVVNG